MRLLNVQLHSHPYLRSLSLDFSAGENVLLGQNGTGKTTLLELAACVVSSNFGGFADLPLSVDYELALDTATIAVSLTNTEKRRRRPANEFHNYELVDGIEERLVRARERLNWRCVMQVALMTGTRLQVTYSPREGRINLPDGQVAELDPVRPFSDHGFLGFALMDIAQHLQRDDMHLLSMSAAEATEAADNCFRFDEAAGAFYSMIGEEPRPTEFSIAESHRPGGEAFRYPFAVRRTPREFVGAALRAAPSWEGLTKDDPLPSTYLYDHDAEFLQTACHAMALEAARIELRPSAREVRDEESIWHFRGLRLEFAGPRNNLFTHEALSFGQKRLLSFLYYAECNPQVIIADELVNGLHHQWIRLALDRIKGRQLFLSSQNPLLLDHLEFESADEVRRTFIVCSRDNGEMNARNLTKEEASVFFRRIRAGVQHVSEILAEMELW